MVAAWRLRHAVLSRLFITFKGQELNAKYKHSAPQLVHSTGAVEHTHTHTQPNMKLIMCGNFGRGFAVRRNVEIKLCYKPCNNIAVRMVFLMRAAG